jgi:hypothetical protein
MWLLYLLFINCSFALQRFFERLFIVEFFIILIIITFSLMKNLVSGMDYRQTMRLITWLTALNNKLLIGGIFCNLHKAFDCVNHDILLSKTEFCGISGKTNNLIKSYLQGRRQRTLVDYDSEKYYSKWDIITHGVPQGSILGPLFFLLHVNDIPHVISDISNQFYALIILAW